MPSGLSQQANGISLSDTVGMCKVNAVDERVHVWVPYNIRSLLTFMNIFAFEYICSVLIILKLQVRLYCLYKIGTRLSIWIMITILVLHPSSLLISKMFIKLIVNIKP